MCRLLAYTGALVTGESTSFCHRGRKDGLQLSHWVKVDENSEEEDKGILSLSLRVLLNLRS